MSSVTATPRTRPNGDRMKSIAHLLLVSLLAFAPAMAAPRNTAAPATLPPGVAIASGHELATDAGRSEEQTSEFQSLMRNSYAVFCLKTKKHKRDPNKQNTY